MPVYFQNPPFLWTLGALALLALIFGIRAFLAYRRLPGEAADDWDYQVSQNMQDLRLTKDAYIRAYKKVHAPRGVMYIASVCAGILVLTPVAFAFINTILMTLWNSSDEPVQENLRGGGIRENVESLTFEPGNLVWGFFTFFGIIAIWVFIVAMAARHFYRNSPGLMRDELIAERAGFRPERPLTVGANPAHIVASSDGIDEGRPTRAQYAAVFEKALGLSRQIDKNYMGSGHVCDIYSDGSEMQIHVHSSGNPKKEFEKDTHPFLFKHDHAREDDKETIYSVIRHIEGAHDCFEQIDAVGLRMEDVTGNANSRMRSFRHDNFEIFIYNK